MALIYEKVINQIFLMVNFETLYLLQFTAIDYLPGSKTAFEFPIFVLSLTSQAGYFHTKSFYAVQGFQKWQIIGSKDKRLDKMERFYWYNCLVCYIQRLKPTAEKSKPIRRHFRRRKLSKEHQK